MNEIFKKLVKEKISPNSLYVLYCIKHNVKVSDLVNEDLEKIRLLTNDWLNDDLSLSQKSIIFTEEIDSYFKRSKKKTSQEIMGSNFEVCIKTCKEIVTGKQTSHHLTNH